VQAPSSSPATASSHTERLSQAKVACDVISEAAPSSPMREPSWGDVSRKIERSLRSFVGRLQGEVAVGGEEHVVTRRLPVRKREAK
jgi:hypothetical protein